MSMATVTPLVRTGYFCMNRMAPLEDVSIDRRLSFGYSCSQLYETHFWDRRSERTHVAYLALSRHCPVWQSKLCWCVLSNVVARVQSRVGYVRLTYTVAKCHLSSIILRVYSDRKLPSRLRGNSDIED